MRGCLSVSSIKNTLLVHAGCLDDNDIHSIAGRGASVSHNPESNMNLASGIDAVPYLSKFGVTVGPCTGGCAGNNNQDICAGILGF